MTVQNLHRATLGAALVLLLPVLAACTEEEQGRALLVDKGVYAGPADTPLSEAQRSALRQRATSQGF